MENWEPGLSTLVKQSSTTHALCLQQCVECGVDQAASWDSNFSWNRGKILLGGEQRFIEQSRATGALGHEEWHRVAALTILLCNASLVFNPKDNLRQL